MIVSKVEKQPKLNKVVVVAPKASAAKTANVPQVSAANSALPKVRAVETAAVPRASAVRTTAVPQASANKSGTMPKVCAHSQIRDRAFENFEKRGSGHGYDLQDWYRAERQLQAQ
jgi:uncharacterized protein involved in copper resistance